MNKTKKLSLAALLLALVCALTAFTFTACGGSSVEITLSQTEVTIAEGGKANVVATVKGSDEDIEWSVDNNRIVEFAVIGKMCVVSAKKEGNATLTAAIGDAKATCAITVTPDNTERVTITLDGTAVTEATVDMGNSITLAATASNGSAITWETSNANIATVANGVVTGVKPGEATITAKVSASIKAEVTVTVNGGDYEYYELTLNKGAEDAAKNPGKWAYWTEWAQFTTLNYDNGTVNLEFTENGGNWYNLQLFKVDTLVQANKYYKLTCEIQTTAAGHVTINGNAVELQTGKHTYEVYFTNGNGFNMQFGVEGMALDISAATVAISNISYTEDTERVTLSAPSYSYAADTGIITITDGNAAGVKNYVLNLYQGTTKITGVVVAQSGVKVDLSKVANGTYQAKLQAIAANVHYIDSDESAATEITVNNEGGISYSFGDTKDANGATAIAQAGIWTYWCESWVSISGNFADDKLTVEFSNNAGNWYDTQLFYRHPGLENGKLYKLTLALNSTAGGRVTLNGSEFTIQQGAHDYDVVFKEVGGLSVQFTFGLDGQNNAQEITAATMVFEIKGVVEVQATTLSAPSFSIASNVITITDGNSAGVGKYELGFFNGEELVTTVTVTNGAEIDLSQVAAGTYTVKLRAVAESMLYVTSDWSSTTAQITSNNANVPIGYSEEGSLTSGWAYWDSKVAADWNSNTKATCSSCTMDTDGKITMTYTCEGNGAAWAMQMFYKANDGASKWDTTLTVKADVACTITVCGQSVTLEANTAQQVTVTNYSSGNGSAIDIQFGCTGGTFEISSINVTAANA